MRLLFKQRMLSWLGAFDIFDEEQRTVYTVKGRLAWSPTLCVYNNIGTHVATLKGKIFSLWPKFDIYMDSELVGTVTKEFTFLKHKFNVDYNGWTVEGEFLGMDYTILDCAMNTVAHISKKFALTDTYVIDVISDENALISLLIVLAIDAEKASGRND